MTVQRRFGFETEMSTWLRTESRLGSIGAGLAITDADLVVHNYRNPADNQYGREVQQLMLVEVKCNNGALTPSQHETLFFWHQLTCRKDRNLIRPGRPKVRVWSYGAYILRMEKSRPYPEIPMQWGRFSQGGMVEWLAIDCDTLIALLRLDIAPDTFEPIDYVLRPHHKTTCRIIRQRVPLGFNIEQLLVTRS